MDPIVEAAMINADAMKALAMAIAAGVGVLGPQAVRRVSPVLGRNACTGE